MKSLYNSLIFMGLILTQASFACPSGQHEQCVLWRPWPARGCAQSICVNDIVPQINPIPDLPIDRVPNGNYSIHEVSTSILKLYKVMTEEYGEVDVSPISMETLKEFLVCQSIPSKQHAEECGAAGVSCYVAVTAGGPIGWGVCTAAGCAVAGAGHTEKCGKQVGFIE